MNRLAAETSPYLRQHADNPVDWYPWGPEAFEKARKEDKPLLVSVGYSACHWCHVMERESFSDPETARLMNEHFVNVKVDREERPDVDAVTMNAVLSLTGHGGWPTTVFMTPDGRPFWAGTYFPPRRRGGMPSFREVLEAVARAWRDKRDEVVANAQRLSAAIEAAFDTSQRPDTLPEAEAVRRRLLSSLERRHDPTWGGFGRAPKFPQIPTLSFLSRVAESADPSASAAEEMLERTLRMMATGGIFDHLEGGYHRYSVDREWIVPHFEKMLPDQALALSAHVRRWRTTRDPLHLEQARATVAYVRGHLTLEGGGVASSQDADSEGVEGLYYTWTPDEVAEVVGGRHDPGEVCRFWGIVPEGHLEGRSVLHRADRAWEPLPENMAAARDTLREARRSRTPPALDDKVILEWNARWVAALAEAALVADHDDWAQEALRTAEFLVTHMHNPSEGWFRTWHPRGGARHQAFAADLAALVDAFSRLYELTGRAAWALRAVETAATLWERHRSPAGGLWESPPRDGEPHYGVADLQDSAAPSTNSTAAVALARLWALTGDERWRTAAEELVACGGPILERAPEAAPELTWALELLEDGCRQVVIAGARPDLVRTAAEALDARTVLVWGERWESAAWEGKTDGFAYACRGFVCDQPVASADELRRQLAER